MRQELQNKNVILYRRVSTTDQKENGNSLNTQLHSLKAFAHNNGMQVIAEYEEDFSAKNFERPEFNHLRDFVKMNKNKVDYILITSWDRFSRNTYEALGVIGEMRELGVEINSIENWIDHDDPQQLMMKLLYLGMPEVDNKIKSQKVKVNMRQGLKEGRWNRAQPIGYIPGRDPENPNKPLMQKNPEKAPLIAELFRDFSMGTYSQNELRKMVKYESLKLSKSNMSRLLKNEVYAGKILVPAYKDEPEELVEALHEAIVDWETFERVQYQLGQRSRYKHKPVRVNEHLPLRGHLQCSECGGNLTGSGSKSKTGKKHYYYHCNPRKGCNVRFKVEDAHDEFDRLISQMKPDPEVSELFKLILEEKYESSEKTKYSKIKELNKDIDRLKKRKDKLLSTLLDGVISNAIFKTNNVKIQNEILDRNASLDRLGDYRQDLRKYMNFGVNMLENFKELYDRADVSIKKKLLSSILDENLVFTDKKYRTPKFKEGFSYIYKNINGLQRMKNKKEDKLSNISLNVLEAGLEPARPQWSLDFKSNVSTNSTTRAELKQKRAKDGI